MNLERETRGATAAGTVMSPAAALFLDPAVRQDPYPAYAQLRSMPPPFASTPFPFVALSTYADVSAALRDTERFSSAVMARADSTLLGADPPRHTTTRRIAMSAFTPERIAALDARMREVSARCVDAMVAAGTADLVAWLALPLPLAILAELLGVGAEREGDLERWAAVMLAEGGGSAGGRVAAETADRAELDAFLAELVARRMRERGPDVLSAVLHTASSDGALSPDEARSFGRLLLVAGTETTTNLIGNCVLALLRHSHALAAVRRDPKHIPAVVQETLRYDTPVQLVQRRTTVSMVVSGVAIPSGTVVLLLLGSANRDERQFPSADRFDPGRPAGGHLAFGAGPHHCLGALLARREAECALRALLSRAAAFVAAEPLDDVVLVDSLQLRGPARLLLSLRL